MKAFRGIIEDSWIAGTDGVIFEYNGIMGNYRTLNITVTFQANIIIAIYQSFNNIGINIVVVSITWFARQGKVGID